MDFDAPAQTWAFRQINWKACGSASTISQVMASALALFLRCGFTSRLWIWCSGVPLLRSALRGVELMTHVVAHWIPFLRFAVLLRRIIADDRELCTPLPLGDVHSLLSALEIPALSNWETTPALNQLLSNWGKHFSYVYARRLADDEEMLAVLDQGQVSSGSRTAGNTKHPCNLCDCFAGGMSLMNECLASNRRGRGSRGCGYRRRIRCEYGLVSASARSILRIIRRRTLRGSWRRAANGRWPPSGGSYHRRT